MRKWKLKIDRIYFWFTYYLRKLLGIDLVYNKKQLLRNLLTIKLKDFFDEEIIVDFNSESLHFKFLIASDEKLDIEVINLDTKLRLLSSPTEYATKSGKIQLLIGENENEIIKILS